MITYLQLHPNVRLTVAWLALAGLLVVIGWAARRWLFPQFCLQCWFANTWDRIRWQRDPGDEWEQLDPDTAADTLIAEWHDLPGPGSGVVPVQARAGEHHERLVTRDVWDEWWAGLDGLDRELLLVKYAREREERLWAELVAETRELCGAAA